VSGETALHESGWTPDTLKALVEGEIKALRDLVEGEIKALRDVCLSEMKRLEEVIALQDRAVTLLGNANQVAQDKFEATVISRFAQVNEFRGSLDDLGKNMATRRELEAFIVSYREAHEQLAEQVADLRSRLDIGPAGLAALQTGAATQVGRQQGVQFSTGLFFAGLAALGTLIGIIVVIANTLTN
jgi:hypothetical protein